MNISKKYENRIRVYIEERFSVGIEPYIQSLSKNEVKGENILDAGCGPGHWTFAAAKLNPNASVIGIDINDLELNFAEKYRSNNNIKNCSFMKMSYEDLPKKFQSNSFDVIICNSVIQFIDDRKALCALSSLLKPKGILIMFYNPDKGYYLERLIKYIYTINAIGTINCLLILVGISKYIPVRIRGKYSEHSTSFRNFKKILKKLNINLERIENEPKLEYRDNYLGFDSVFSCKGRKA